MWPEVEQAVPGPVCWGCERRGLWGVGQRDVVVGLEKLTQTHVQDCVGEGPGPHRCGAPGHLHPAVPRPAQAEPLAWGQRGAMTRRAAASGPSAPPASRVPGSGGCSPRAARGDRHSPGVLVRAHLPLRRTARAQAPRAGHWDPPGTDHTGPSTSPAPGLLRGAALSLLSPLGPSVTPHTGWAGGQASSGRAGGGGPRSR